MKKILLLIILSALLITGACIAGCTSTAPATTTGAMITIAGTLAPSSVVILHGPRLGLINASSAIVYWETGSPVPGEIEWGTAPDNYPSVLRNASATTRHSFSLIGLSPQTTYHYRIISGGTPSSDSILTTAALPGTGFQFITLADNRGPNVATDRKNATPPFQSIMNLIAAKKFGETSFVLHGGDIFYGGSDLTTEYQLYDAFLRATDPVASQMPFLVSPGNHEMATPANPKEYNPKDLFAAEFSQPPVLPGYEGTVYSWDWGNSHFVSIDTSHYDPAEPTYSHLFYIDNSQISWLDQDLAAAEARGVRHIFVFSHSFAYPETLDNLESLGHYPAQRDQFWQVMAKHHVDAYITGHAHEFSDSFGHDGVVQWLNGNSGSVLSPNGGTGKNEFTLWKVDGDTVTASLINDLGQVVYTRQIVSSQPKI